MAEKLKITFLGTGSAVPTAFRNHISVLMQYKNHNFLFDCGEGTQRQFRKAKLSFNKLTKIFVTHWHGDHILGIPGLLQTLALSGYNGTLEIHGPGGTSRNVEEIKRFFLRQSFDYFNLSKEEGNTFEVKSFEHEKGIIFENKELKVSSFRLNHHPKTIGYSLEIKEKNRIDKDKLKKLKLPNSPVIAELLNGKTVKINGKKIDGKKLIYREPKKKVSFVMDTGYFEQLKEDVKDSDILIIESTFLDEEEDFAKQKKHLTSVQAATIAKKSKTKKLVLVHASQRYDKNPKILKDEAKKVFKGEILMPKDLDRIEI